MEDEISVGSRHKVREKLIASVASKVRDHHNIPDSLRAFLLV